MPARPSNPYVLNISKAWTTAFPKSSAGILAITHIPQTPPSPFFDAKRVEIENELRVRFSYSTRGALENLPTIQAYETYYRKFKKTYHVLLQLESVALKGKSIPNVPPAIGAMFMAELKNQLLTAGHDLSSLQGSLQLGVATGDEHYLLLNGTSQHLKPGDMMISDDSGTISSIIYGPDQRTRLKPESQSVIYTVYGVPGIDEDQIYNHLEDIRDFFLAGYPDSNVAQLKVYGARERNEFDFFTP